MSHVKFWYVIAVVNIAKADLYCMRACSTASFFCASGSDMRYTVSYVGDRDHFITYDFMQFRLVKFVLNVVLLLPLLLCM